MHEAYKKARTRTKEVLEMIKQEQAETAELRKNAAEWSRCSSYTSPCRIDQPFASYVFGYMPTQIGLQDCRLADFLLGMNFNFWHAVTPSSLANCLWCAAIWLSTIKKAVFAV
jgi:hypothetical protein